MDWYSQQPLFLDEEEDPDAQQDELVFSQNKEYVVYLIDAGPDMFRPLEQENAKSSFEAVVKAVSNELKTRIISRDTDEVGVCFFNTRERKNIQESEGVYAYSELGVTSAQLIRDLDRMSEKFEKDIGTKSGRSMDSKESILYNALWVAQAMLRTGSSKNVVKRLFIFTNNDDPLEDASPQVKEDLRRTTIQRAKDAQDLGIEIELFPLNRSAEQFNMKIFYSDMIQVDENDENYMTAAANKFDELENQMRKKVFKKRVIRKMNLTVAHGLEIGLRSYAMVRPAKTGSTIWLDSRANTPLKMERSYICSDTGAIMTGPLKKFHEYSGKKVLFTLDELFLLKKITNVQLQLLGFKPLDCLKDYYNLKPPTFVYPDDEAICGSTRAFIALHRSMIRLQKFALAFYGGTANPVLVALVAQEEESDERGQLQPPGMNMIYLPYSDDIRPAEKYHADNVNPKRGTEEQIEKAIALIGKLDLKEFSVYQIQNPALQRHYAILQALALEEDEIPEIKDETQPDEAGMSRPSVIASVQQFKDLVYGENYDIEMAEAAVEMAKGSAAAQKRKASAEVASKEAKEYDWSNLADTGKLKDLTVVELKYYLTANSLPLSGKKEVLIGRILTHLGK